MQWQSCGNGRHGTEAATDLTLAKGESSGRVTDKITDSSKDGAPLSGDVADKVSGSMVSEPTPNKTTRVTSLDRCLEPALVMV